MISKRKLYDFCKNHYYCDINDEHGNRLIWEPFEKYNREDIELFIKVEMYRLKKFIKAEMPKEWDDESN